VKNEYLNFVEERDRDTKKVVAARVSEDVLRALNMAEKDSERFGYSFSTTNIIDKALNNTLLAIKDHSGIDYYKLVKWQNKILGAYKSFLNCVDLRHATSEVLEAISFPESYNPLPSYDLEIISKFSLQDRVDHAKDGIAPMILRRMRTGRIECKRHFECFPFEHDSDRGPLNLFSRIGLFIHQHSDERFIKITFEDRNQIDHVDDFEKFSANKSLLVQFLRDHPQVLAFCSCPERHGGASAVFVHIKSNPDLQDLSSRKFLIYGVDSVENFDSHLEKRAKEIAEKWNKALTSINSTYRIEVSGDRILFNDSRATDHP